MARVSVRPAEVSSLWSARHGLIQFDDTCQRTIDNGRGAEMVV